MALLTPPGWLQAGTYTALLDRMYSTTVPSLRNFAIAHGARKGFYPSRYPAFSVAAGMDVVVGPCSGIISNGFIADGGDYRFANPTNTQVTLAASSPTLNRNDIIGFQIRDNFYDASGFNDIVPTVVQGTNAAGPPSDPAQPSSFIAVCRAVVSAGVTSPTLQSMLARTVNDGGVLPIGSDGERATLGTPYPGFPIMRTDQGGLLQMWSGSAWVSAPNTAYVHMRANVTQNLTASTWTSIAWQVEDLDNFAMHAATSAVTTCQRAGVWMLSGNISYGVSATGVRATRWSINGAAMTASTANSPGYATLAGAVNARTVLVRLNVGDTVELQGWQNAANPFPTIATAENASSISLLWVAP